MKKKLLLIGVLSTLTTLAATGIIASHCYPQTTVVTEVNYDENLVTVNCLNGNQFQFTGTEDWMKDDICSMIMFDCFTNKVTDDIILDISYDGWF